MKMKRKNRKELKQQIRDQQEIIDAQKIINFTNTLLKHQLENCQNALKAAENALAYKEQREAERTEHTVELIQKSV